MKALPGEKLTDEQRALIDKVAQRIVRWRAAVPAIFTLESMKPLSFVGSQFLYALAPFAQVIFDPTEYESFVLAMEDRGNVEYFLRRIEDIDAEARDEEKAARKKAKQERKRRREERRARRQASRDERSQASEDRAIAKESD